MKQIKRTLAVILSLLMVTCYLPSMAFAAEGGEENNVLESVIPDASTKDEGIAPEDETGNTELPEKVVIEEQDISEEPVPEEAASEEGVEESGDSKADMLMDGETYTLTYDGNGADSGTVPAGPKSYSADAHVSALPNSGNLEKANHIFKGWNSRADGKGMPLDVNQTFQIKEDTTLYAQWTHKHNGIEFTPLTQDSFKTIDTSNYYLESGNYCLTDDMTIYRNLRIVYGASICLCLNGHSLTISGDNYLWVLSGNLTLYDHSYSGKLQAGTGFIVESGSTFTINNAKIVNANTSGICGNVVLNEGTLTINGGTITAGNGITKGIENKGVLNLSGNVVIDGTHSGEDIYVANTTNSNAIINITGELTGGDILTVASEKVPTEGSPVTLAQGTDSYTITDGDTGKFVSSDDSYIVIKEGNTLKLSVAYHITYDGNNAGSGTVPSDTAPYAPGSTVTVIGNTGSLERPGYYFDGWNTKADGTGTTYAQGSTFAISADTTLYAKWTQVPGINLGNGDTSMSGTGWVYDSTTYTLNLNNCTILAGGIVYKGTQELTIDIIGSNSLTGGESSVYSGDNNSYGIYAGSSALTIKGSGSLTVTSGNVTGANSYGIYADSIVIESGTVSATGGAAEYSYGIYGVGQNVTGDYGVQITGGTVTGTSSAATTESYGIELSNANIKMKISGNAVVTGNAGSANDSRGISAGILLEINTTGTVTGTAGNNSSFGASGIRANRMIVENGTVSGTATTGDENKANGIWSTEITLNGGTITGCASGGTKGAIHMASGTTPVSTTGVLEAKAGNDESSAEAVEPGFDNLYNHPWARLIWTHQHDGITFTAWDHADSLPETEGNYYLTGDVTLTGRWEVPSGTTNLCLNGYNITLAENTSDTVVYIGSGAVLNLYDDEGKTGKITGGKGIGSTYSEGGGVYIAGGTFNIYGGIISGNSAKLGGGIYAHSGSTLTMHNGSITNNSASESGGGVYVTDSFTMTGGSIQNNTASMSGGGVYLFNSKATLQVSGNPIITGNKSGDDANNVYVGDTTRIIFGNAGLEDTARIGVNMGSNPGVFTSGLSGKGTVSNFTSDDSDYNVSLNSSGEAFLTSQNYVAVVGGTKYETLQAAYYAAPDNSTIKLISDIEIPATVSGRLLTASEAKTVTLDLNGYTAKGVGSERYFVYIGKGTLILHDSEDGGAIRATGDSNYCIFVASEANLIIESGEYSSYSNIIQSNKSSTVEIRGGTLKTEGNSAVAAMTIGGNAVFSGGTIEVSRDARAIEVCGELTITGGTVQSYSTEKAAIWLYYNSNIGTNPSAGISGGTINGSLQIQSGTNGTYTITGGTFSQPVPDAYCAAGYMPWDKGDGTYSVEEFCTITFNANDASQTPGTKTQKVSKRTGSATLDLNTFTLTGFTFAGWNTQADGNGISYADGAVIEAVTTDLTLYALWSAPVTVPTLWGANVDLLGATILQIWTQFPDNTDVAYVKMTINGREYETPLSGAAIRKANTLSNDNTSQIYKVFSCPVYAKELNDKVSIQMLDASRNPVGFSYRGDSLVTEYEYSVKDYLGSAGITGSSNQHLKDFAAAMKDYANYAKYYFDNRDGTTSYDGKTPTPPAESEFNDYKLVTSGNSTDISFAAGNLDLQEVTSLRVYFDGNVSGYTFTYVRDGETKTLDASQKKHGWNYVEIPDIKVTDLDTMWTITATKGSSTYTVQYGAMTYVRSVLYGNNNASRTLKDYMAELYYYNDKAEDYFNHRL